MEICAGGVGFAGVKPTGWRCRIGQLESVHGATSSYIDFQA